MSGPKVVRVVSREEVIATCQGNLARLDAALAAWIRVGQQNALLGDPEIAASKRRREAIANLLKADRFLDLQKQASQEIDFLRRDAQRIVSEAATAATMARSRQRRHREGVQALLNALDNSGRPVPEALHRALQDPDNAGALSEAWRLLGSSANLPAPDYQKLTAIYGEGLERRSLADWAATQTSSEGDPELKALDQKMAELGLLDAKGASEFEARLAEVERSQGARRHLLLDSLNLDLGRVLSQAREQHKLVEGLSLLLAELATIEPHTATTLQRKSEIASLTELHELNDVVRRELAVAQAQQAAALRRAVMLQSLSALGYEVTEGMSTAWVEEGRLIVRNATRADYGVEISGDLSKERVQMRAVAFADEATPQDPARDRDAETIWCSEVGELNKSLQEAGGNLQIERAWPIGATPLKRVADSTGQERHQSRESGIKQERSLRHP